VETNLIIEVELELHEIAICRMIGNMRSVINRSTSVTNLQMGKQDPFSIDEDGVIGEYAFCKHWNIFFDPTIKPRSGTADCELMDMAFDIKATRRLDGRLLAGLKPNPEIDFYALAIIQENKVIFPGYASAADLIKEENIKNLGHGNGYVLDQSQLKQWKSKWLKI